MVIRNVVVIQMILKNCIKKDDICSHIAEILHAHEDSYYFFILSRIHRKQVYIVQNHIIKDSTMDFYESERSSVSWIITIIVRKTCRIISSRL